MKGNASRDPGDGMWYGRDGGVVLMAGGGGQGGKALTGYVGLCAMITVRR